MKDAELGGWREVVFTRSSVTFAVLLCVAVVLTVRAVRLPRPGERYGGASILGSDLPPAIRNEWAWRYPTTLRVGETGLMMVDMGFHCRTEPDCPTLLRSSATEAQRTVAVHSAGMTFSPGNTQVAKASGGNKASAVWTISPAQAGHHWLLLDLSSGFIEPSASDPEPAQILQAVGRKRPPLGMHLGEIEVAPADPWYARPASAALAAWVAALAALVPLIVQLWRRLTAE